METLTKPKQTKTPRQFESIEKGALALLLEDRVMLKKSIQLSIENELKQKQADYEKAAKLVNGEK